MLQDLSAQVKNPTSGLSTESDSINAVDPEGEIPFPFIGVPQTKPGNGVLSAGVQTSSRRANQGDRRRDTPILEPQGPVFCRKRRPTWYDTSPREVQRLAQKRLQGPNNPQEGACGQREKERLNRDSKDVRNPPRNSNAQADPANEMVLKLLT